MTIKEYIKEYTAGRRICFSDILREIKELFREKHLKINTDSLK